MGLQCPICGAATAYVPARAEQSAIDLARSTIGKETYFKNVLAEAVVDGSNVPDCYAICRCQNCQRFFVAGKERYYDDWEPVWPLPRTATMTGDVPEDVRLAFEEAQKCFVVRAYGGCLLMCRTTIIRLQRDREVSALKELKEKDLISGMLYGQADEVRYWANMAGHDDFDQGALTSEALAELMAFIEALLNAVYVEPARLAALKAARMEAASKEDEPD